MQDAVQGSISFFAPLNWLFAVLFDISIRFLWGVINSAQLMEFLSLICVPLPTAVHLFLRSLAYANGDIAVLEQLSEYLTTPINM